MSGGKLRRHSHARTPRNRHEDPEVSKWAASRRRARERAREKGLENGTAREKGGGKTSARGRERERMRARAREFRESALCRDKGARVRRWRVSRLRRLLVSRVRWSKIITGQQTSSEAHRDQQ
eukprot:6203693-Pleurochrysis_carterae.AAC.2